MLYVKVDLNGTPVDIPVTEDRLRAVLTNVSLPQTLTANDLAAIGYAELPEDNRVIERQMFHSIGPDIPTLDENGVPQRVYKFTPYKPGELQGRWASLRMKRDKLLSDSDITQLADYPISPQLRAQWVTYRQALRDMTSQSEDPQMIVWPTAPIDQGGQS
jgi:hypothetical protein